MVDSCPVVKKSKTSRPPPLCRPQARRAKIASVVRRSVCESGIQRCKRPRCQCLSQGQGEDGAGWCRIAASRSRTPQHRPIRGRLHLSPVAELNPPVTQGPLSVATKIVGCFIYSLSHRFSGPTIDQERQPRKIRRHAGFWQISRAGRRG